jgi:hypothetical protein
MPKRPKQASSAQKSDKKIHVTLGDAYDEADLFALNYLPDPPKVKHQDIKVLGLRLK